MTNRDKLLKRLARVPANSGHAKILRAKLGITKESTPLEVVEEPPIEEKVVVKKAKVAKKSSFWKGKGK